MLKKTLEEIGEILLLSNMIIPSIKLSPELEVGPGDDAAVITWSEDTSLVWTIDPCPLPVAWIIGNHDYYDFGWYSVAINLSDIAAMGAKPVGFLSSIEAQGETDEQDLKALIAGINDCAESFSCPVLGGNIKDASTLSVVGTAIGQVKPGTAWTRKGAQVGDSLALVGGLGEFWAAVLTHKYSLPMESTYKQLFQSVLKRPQPKIKEAMVLRENVAISSCMDVSDGITNCIFELADKSQKDICLDYNSIEVDPHIISIFEEAGVKVESTLMAWGDWQLVCTLPQSDAEKAKSIIEKTGGRFSIIGSVTGDGGQALAQVDGIIRELNPKLRGERFSGNSYFSKGLDNYINLLRSESLFLSRE